MPNLGLHNMLAHSSCRLEPLPSGIFTLCSCGPKVYDAHVGNLRSFLNADVLQAAIKLLGLREGTVDRITASDWAAKCRPGDFLLRKPDARHLMRGPSRCGQAYPGWNIECSVMVRMLLGDFIDIHFGGEYKILPHHACEIAHGCCASGAMWSRGT